VVSPSGVAATAHDPVVALDWPRPDFRLACTEFLIGLLATACPPEDHYAWRESYRAPPDAATLQAAFSPLTHAFVLDGDGPRFMQDFADFRAEPNDVGTLLIEAPGENTTKRNTDLMVRRGRVGVLSRAAAAMALFTLQTYAPSGGAGNRVSLRGGGPLTTLALPPRRLGDAETVLWHSLWPMCRGAIPPTRKICRACSRGWPLPAPRKRTGAPPHLPMSIRCSFGGECRAASAWILPTTTARPAT
jgi:CRISPR system Cascade subunit CasA